MANRKSTNTTSVNAKEQASKAIIRFNKDACGIELVIPNGRRLSIEEKQILSSLGFCWHKKNCYFYTKYTEEKMELVRTSFLGKDAVFPAKTEEKVLKGMAIEEAKRRAEAKAKAPAKTKASVQSAELSELKTMISEQSKVMADFTTTVAQLIKAIVPVEATK